MHGLSLQSCKGPAFGAPTPVAFLPAGIFCRGQVLIERNSQFVHDFSLACLFPTDQPLASFPRPDPRLVFWFPNAWNGLPPPCNVAKGRTRSPTGGCSWAQVHIRKKLLLRMAADRTDGENIYQEGIIESSRSCAQMCPGPGLPLTSGPFSVRCAAQWSQLDGCLGCCLGASGLLEAGSPWTRHDRSSVTRPYPESQGRHWGHPGSMAQGTPLGGGT